MAAERLSRGWLIVSAVVALAALYGLGSSVTWLISMAEAPDTRVWMLPFIGATLACAVLAVAVPVFRSRPMPRWARIALPIFVGVFALVAAVGVWFLLALLFCDADGVCRPADTWQAMPGLLTCGVLTAAGPGLLALGAGENWRGRLLALTVVLGLLGFVVALFGWIELNLYPLS